jgi:hypothetical protein
MDQDNSQRFQDAVAGVRCSQAKTLWANPSCRHVWRDTFTYECLAYQANRTCACRNDPSWFHDVLSFEGTYGHTEFRDDGTYIDICEWCRMSPMNRKVTDEESRRKDEEKEKEKKKAKTLKEIEKEMEKIELRR